MQSTSGTRGRAFSGHLQQENGKNKSLVKPQTFIFFCKEVIAYFCFSFFHLQELYSQYYPKVGVFFAAIPNFSDFYIELDANNQGMECLRVLNEILVDFDEVSFPCVTV